MSDRQKFAVLRGPRRVWAIGAIHGEAARLMRLHDALWPRLELCDRIVYLGNAIGRGPDSCEVLDALLHFRREVLARPHSDIDDVVYLRGSQEEMWQKLLQLQFANDPRGVLRWMFDQGVDATLRSYGVVPEDAVAVLAQDLPPGIRARRRAGHGEQIGHTLDPGLGHAGRAVEIAVEATTFWLSLWPFVFARGAKCRVRRRR